MNRILYNILDDVNEGIIILNVKMEICFWNNYMEYITSINREEALNNSIYKILSNMDRQYYIKAMNDVVNNENTMFFSAAMHKGLIKDNLNLNLKISPFEEDKTKFLLLEFIDVTNQSMQIEKLKNYVSELFELNHELKNNEEVFKKLAYYDNLTGVANRTLFYELAEKFLYNAERNNSIFCLMFIDIDNFKSINDTFGHKAGDQVLFKIAEILTQTTRNNDIVARYGGDEFLILLPSIKYGNNCEAVTSRIIDAIKIISYEGNPLNISLSIGISYFPYDGNTIDTLIAKADKAMYAAKKSGDVSVIPYYDDSFSN